MGRPVTDFWLLAKPKVPYYGAYLCGFPERARYLLGASIDDPVLHVCGGQAKKYPYPGGFGPNDKTLDINPELEPDFLRNALDPLPWNEVTFTECENTANLTFEDTSSPSVSLTSTSGTASSSIPPVSTIRSGGSTLTISSPWKHILVDPPYSEEDHKSYTKVPSSAFPALNPLVTNCLGALQVGGRLGIIHYMVPKIPSCCKQVALVAVVAGTNTRIRVFTVLERIS